jgi:hypothetical protein
MGEINARNTSCWLRIINKSLSLHIVGCLYYLFQRRTVKQISNLKDTASIGRVVGEERNVSNYQNICLQNWGKIGQPVYLCADIWTHDLRIRSRVLDVRWYYQFQGWEVVQWRSCGSMNDGMKEPVAILIWERGISTANLQPTPPLYTIRYLYPFHTSADSFLILSSLEPCT